MSSRKTKKTARPSILRAPAAPDCRPAVPHPVSTAQAQAAFSFPEAFEVRVQVLGDPHATVARAVFAEAGTWQPVYTATGASRVDATDAYDPEIGTALAVSRALHAVARQLYKQANGLVQHAESNRRQQAARRRPGKHAK